MIGRIVRTPPFLIGVAVAVAFLLGGSVGYAVGMVVCVAYICAEGVQLLRDRYAYIPPVGGQDGDLDVEISTESGDER